MIRSSRRAARELGEIWVITPDDGVDRPLRGSQEMVWPVSPTNIGGRNCDDGKGSTCLKVFVK